MNLNIEISPEEIGSYFAQDLPAAKVAINTFADWLRTSGIMSYDEYMKTAQSKEMAIRFALYLKNTDDRATKRVINFFKDTAEAYENAETL